MYMPLVSKECFPASSQCHNCERKVSNEVKKETDPKEHSQRCSSCHLLRYCDRACQREHWIKVHKHHCRFLSGRVPVNGSKHNSATCARCIEERGSSPTQIRSENSPKSVCKIEEVAIAMKKDLGAYFEFHGEGKKCDCSLEYGCHLPFPLGEVSGQYVEIGGTGIDAMLAHSSKIIAAMFIKAKKVEHQNALSQLWSDIIKLRSKYWFNIIICGVPLYTDIKHLKHFSDQVDSLQTIYGALNPWWEILRFSVFFVGITNTYLSSNFCDSRSLEDARFQRLKLIIDYRKSQLQNQAIVCEKKMWHILMLWPGVVNGSLAILLSPGTRCQSCDSELRGQVALGSFSSSPHLPFILKGVGDNGGLMISCPVTSCRVNILNKYMPKNVEFRMRKDEEEWKECLKEDELFYIEARECDFCDKSSLSSHRCSACLCVQYCSTVCQKEDLNFHKSVCASWANDESRKILGRGKQKKHWKSVVFGEQ